MLFYILGGEDGCMQILLMCVQVVHTGHCYVHIPSYIVLLEYMYVRIYMHALALVCIIDLCIILLCICI